MNEWQKPKFKPWLRGVAFLTTVFFSSSNIVHADQATLNKSQTVSAPLVSRGALSLADLPESIGQIKKNFQGSRDRIVIHIQDAHANEEAQRNIAAILDYFASQHQLKLVNLEGAEGRLRTELFTFVPDQKSRQYVSDYFLKEARLTGPEYEAIVNRPDLTLYGIEDRAIYEKNRKAYLDALDFKEQDEKVLTGLEKALNDVSRFLFPEELRELNRRRESFQQGSHELVGYVRYLVETAKKQNISLYEYPRLDSLLELVKLEGEIDFERADKEIESLTSDLKNIISKERFSQFVANTVQFRMKKMKRAEYYGYLEGVITAAAPAQGSADKYSNVLKYLRYSQLYDSIGVDIFDEIESIEKVIKDKCFTSPEQVRLDQLFKIFGTTRKMFDFSLTKQDADFFYAYRQEFKAASFRTFLEPLLKKYKFYYGLPADLETLDRDLPRVEQFYEVALTRDRILIQKAMEKMERDNQKIMVIVTGGFHTPGIEKYLREHDYSYLVIMPRISKQINAKKENILYQNSLKQKLSPLESKLVESYFPPVSNHLNDPHFQLSAWHETDGSDRTYVAAFSDALAGGYFATVDHPETLQHFGGVLDRNASRTSFWHQDPASENFTAYTYVPSGKAKEARAEIRNLDPDSIQIPWGETGNLHVARVPFHKVPDRITDAYKDSQLVVLPSNRAEARVSQMPSAVITRVSEKEREMYRIAKRRLTQLMRWNPKLDLAGLQSDKNPPAELLEHWSDGERNALLHHLMEIERGRIKPENAAKEIRIPKYSKKIFYSGRVQNWIRNHFAQSWDQIQEMEQAAGLLRHTVLNQMEALKLAEDWKKLDPEEQNAVKNYVMESQLAIWNKTEGKKRNLPEMTAWDLWEGNLGKYIAGGIRYDHTVLAFLALNDRVPAKALGLFIAEHLTYEENGQKKNILLNNIAEQIEINQKNPAQLEAIGKTLDAIPELKTLDAQFPKGMEHSLAGLRGEIETLLNSDKEKKEYAVQAALSQALGMTVRILKIDLGPLGIELDLNPKSKRVYRWDDLESIVDAISRNTDEATWVSLDDEQTQVVSAAFGLIRTNQSLFEQKLQEVSRAETRETAEPAPVSRAERLRRNLQNLDKVIKKVEKFDAFVLFITAKKKALQSLHQQYLQQWDVLEERRKVLDQKLSIPAHSAEWEAREQEAASLRTESDRLLEDFKQALDALNDHPNHLVDIYKKPEMKAARQKAETEIKQRRASIQRALLPMARTIQSRKEKAQRIEAGLLKGIRIIQSNINLRLNGVERSLQAADPLPLRALRIKITKIARKQAPIKNDLEIGLTNLSSQSPYVDHPAIRAELDAVRQKLAQRLETANYALGLLKEKKTRLEAIQKIEKFYADKKQILLTAVQPAKDLADQLRAEAEAFLNPAPGVQPRLPKDFAKRMRAFKSKALKAQAILEAQLGPEFSDMSSYREDIQALILRTPLFTAQQKKKSFFEEPKVQDVERRLYSDVMAIVEAVDAAAKILDKLGTHLDRITAKSSELVEEAAARNAAFEAWEAGQQQQKDAEIAQMRQTEQDRIASLIQQKDDYFAAKRESTAQDELPADTLAEIYALDQLIDKAHAFSRRQRAAKRKAIEMKNAWAQHKALPLEWPTREQIWNRRLAEQVKTQETIDRNLGRDTATDIAIWRNALDREARESAQALAERRRRRIDQLEQYRIQQTEPPQPTVQQPEPVSAAVRLESLIPDEVPDVTPDALIVSDGALAALPSGLVDLAMAINDIPVGNAEKFTGPKFKAMMEQLNRQNRSEARIEGEEEAIALEQRHRAVDELMKVMKARFRKSIQDRLTAALDKVIAEEEDDLATKLAAVRETFKGEAEYGEQFPKFYASLLADINRIFNEKSERLLKVRQQQIESLAGVIQSVSSPASETGVVPALGVPSENGKGVTEPSPSDEFDQIVDIHSAPEPAAAPAPEAPKVVPAPETEKSARGGMAVPRRSSFSKFVRRLAVFAPFGLAGLIGLSVINRKKEEVPAPKKPKGRSWTHVEELVREPFRPDAELAQLNVDDDITNPFLQPPAAVVEEPRQEENPEPPAPIVISEEEQAKQAAIWKGEKPKNLDEIKDENIEELDPDQLEDVGRRDQGFRRGIRKTVMKEEKKDRIREDKLLPEESREYLDLKPQIEALMKVLPQSKDPDAWTALDWYDNLRVYFKKNRWDIGPFNNQKYKTKKVPQANLFLEALRIEIEYLKNEFYPEEGKWKNKITQDKQQGEWGGRAAQVLLPPDKSDQLKLLDIAGSDENWSGEGSKVSVHMILGQAAVRAHAYVNSRRPLVGERIEIGLRKFTSDSYNTGHNFETFQRAEASYYTDELEGRYDEHTKLQLDIMTIPRIGKTVYTDPFDYTSIANNADFRQKATWYEQSIMKYHQAEPTHWPHYIPLHSSVPTPIYRHFSSILKPAGAGHAAGFQTKKTKPPGKISKLFGKLSGKLFNPFERVTNKMEPLLGLSQFGYLVPENLAVVGQNGGLAIGARAAAGNAILRHDMNKQMRAMNARIDRLQNEINRVAANAQRQINQEAHVRAREDARMRNLIAEMDYRSRLRDDILAKDIEHLKLREVPFLPVLDIYVNWLLTDEAASQMMKEDTDKDAKSVNLAKLSHPERMDRLVMMMNALWEEGDVQTLLQHEIGPELVDFINDVRSGQIAEKINYVNKGGYVVGDDPEDSSFKEIARLAEIFDAHVEALPRDVSVDVRPAFIKYKALKKELDDYEREKLLGKPNPQTEERLGAEYPKAAGQFYYRLATTMQGLYMNFTLAHYGSAIKNGWKEKEDVLKFVEMEAKILPHLEKLVGGKLSLLKDYDDSGFLTASAQSFYKKGMSPKRAALLLTLMKKRRLEALDLFITITQQKISNFNLTENGNHMAFLAWWAGERAMGGELQPWLDFFNDQEKLEKIIELAGRERHMYTNQMPFSLEALHKLGPKDDYLGYMIPKIKDYFINKEEGMSWEEWAELEEKTIEELERGGSPYGKVPEVNKPPVINNPFGRNPAVRQAAAPILLASAGLLAAKSDEKMSRRNLLRGTLGLGLLAGASAVSAVLPSAEAQDQAHPRFDSIRDAFEMVDVLGIDPRKYGDDEESKKEKDEKGKFESRFFKFKKGLEKDPVAQSWATSWTKSLVRDNFDFEKKSQEEGPGKKIAGLIRKIGLEGLEELSRYADIYWQGFDNAFEQAHETIDATRYSDLSEDAAGRFMAFAKRAAENGWEKEKIEKYAKEMKRFFESLRAPKRMEEALALAAIPEEIAQDFDQAKKPILTRDSVRKNLQSHQALFTAWADDHTNWIKRKTKNRPRSEARQMSKPGITRRLFFKAGVSVTTAIAAAVGVPETVLAQQAGNAQEQRVGGKPAVTLLAQNNIVPPGAARIPDIPHQPQMVAQGNILVRPLFEPGEDEPDYIKLRDVLQRDHSRRNELIRDVLFKEKGLKHQPLEVTDAEIEAFDAALKKKDRDARGKFFALGAARVNRVKDDPEKSWEMTKGLGEAVGKVLKTSGFQEAAVKFIKALLNREVDLSYPYDRGILEGLAEAVSSQQDPHLAIRDILQKFEEMAWVAPLFIGRDQRDTKLENSKAARYYERIKGAKFDSESSDAMGWLIGEMAYMVGLIGRDQRDLVLREKWTTLRDENARAVYRQEQVKERHDILEKASDPQVQLHLRNFLRLLSENADRALDTTNPVDYGFLINWVRERKSLGWNTEGRELYSRFVYLLTRSRLGEYLEELGIAKNFSKELKDSFALMERKANGEQVPENEIRPYYRLMGYISFFTRYKIQEIDEKLNISLRTLEALKRQFGSTQRVLDAMTQLFSELKIDPPIDGSVIDTDAPMAHNYYELREMMKLLSVLGPYRAEHGLADDHPVPPAYVAQVKEEYRAEFLESLLPGFAKMIESRPDQPVKKVVDDFQAILRALVDYPIEYETRDPRSQYNFDRFLEKLKEEGIPFDEGSNQSRKIYRNIFTQMQLMGNASWWLDQMLPTANKPLTLDQVLEKIQRKKTLWGLYKDYWKELHIPVTSAEISFLESLGWTYQEYTHLFEVGVQLEGWAQEHLHRQLFFDEVIFWTLAPGMYRDDEIHPLRGGLSQVLAALSGGKILPDFIPRFRMENTFANILAKDPDQRWYYMALDPENEINRFLRWHGEAQLFRVLDDRELSQWRRLLDSLKREVPLDLEESEMAEILMKNFLFIGREISEGVRSLALGAKLPYTPDMFEDEVVRENYLILRLLARSDEDNLTVQEAPMEMIPFIQEQLRRAAEQQFTLKLLDPETGQEVDPETWLNKIEEEMEKYGTLPTDEAQMKRKIKRIIHDIWTLTLAVQREYGYHLNLAEISRLVIRQRVNGLLHRVLRMEQKITNHFVGVFRNQHEVILSEKESQMSPSELIDAWIREYQLEDTIVDKPQFREDRWLGGRERWAVVLKDRSLTPEVVKAIFRDLQLIRQTWREARIPRNEGEAPTLVEEMLGLISQVRLLGLYEYGLITRPPFIEYEQKDEYLAMKEKNEQMMAADLGDHASQEIYMANAETEKGLSREQALTQIEIGDARRDQQREIAWSLGNKIAGAFAAFLSLLTLMASFLHMRQRKERGHTVRYIGELGRIEDIYGKFMGVIHPDKTIEGPDGKIIGRVKAVDEEENEDLAEIVSVDGKSTIGIIREDMKYVDKEGKVLGQLFFSDRVAVSRNIFETWTEFLTYFGTLGISIYGALYAKGHMGTSAAGLLTFLGPVWFLSYYFFAKILPSRGHEPGERVTKGATPLRWPNLIYFSVVFVGAIWVFGFHYLRGHLFGTSQALFAVPMIVAFIWLGLTTSHIIPDRVVTLLLKKFKKEEKAEEKTTEEWQREYESLALQIEEQERTVHELQKEEFRFLLRSEARSSLLTEIRRQRGAAEKKLWGLRHRETVTRFKAMTGEEKESLGVPDGRNASIYIITQRTGEDSNAGFDVAVRNLIVSAKANPGENIYLSVQQNGALNGDTKPPETLRQVFQIHDMHLNSPEIFGQTRDTFYYKRGEGGPSEATSRLNPGKKFLSFAEYQRFTGDGIMHAEVDGEAFVGNELRYDSFRKAGFWGALVSIVVLPITAFLGLAWVPVVAVIFFGALLVAFWHSIGVSGQTTRTRTIDGEKINPALSPDLRKQTPFFELLYGDFSKIGFKGKREYREITEGGPKIYVSAAARQKYEEYFKTQTNDYRELSDGSGTYKGIPVIYNYDQKIYLDKRSPQRLWADFILDDKNIVGMVKDFAVRWFAKNYQIYIDDLYDEEEQLDIDAALERIANSEYWRDKITPGQFHELLEEIAAYHSVRKGLEEMAENPRAAMGQPLYYMSNPLASLFAKVTVADAAVIGAFYALAGEFYAGGRANFTGKGPVIKETWLHGIREAHQKIHMAFVKGSTAGMVFGAVAGLWLASVGFPFLIGFLMLAGYFAGGILLGNYEMRMQGGAMVLFFPELSHDYAEGGASGAHVLKRTMNQEDAIDNLKNEFARSVTRWFQGVIPYWRHMLGPGVTLMDRWLMLLAYKMYINDIVLLSWMAAGLTSVTVSGIADRIYAVKRIQEFSRDVVITRLYGFSPLTAFMIGASLLLVVKLIEFIINLKRYDSTARINLGKVASVLLISATSGLATYFLFSISIVTALYMFAIPMMIYFAIFTGAQLGDPAGAANLHQRSVLLYLSTMISLNRPFVTTTSFGLGSIYGLAIGALIGFLSGSFVVAGIAMVIGYFIGALTLGTSENLLRVNVGGAPPRRADKGEETMLRHMDYFYLFGAASFAAASFVLPISTNIVLGALVGSAILIPFLANRTSGRFISVQWLAVGVSVTALIMGIVLINAIWMPGTLPFLANWLLNGITAHWPALLPKATKVIEFFIPGSVLSNAVLFLIELHLVLLMTEGVKRGLMILKEALPWVSFQMVASASSSLSLYDSARMTWGSFVLVTAAVIAAIFFWSNFWVLIWGVSFFASWGFGWLFIWYSSKLLLFSPGMSREETNEAFKKRALAPLVEDAKEAGMKQDGESDADFDKRIFNAALQEAKRRAAATAGANEGPEYDRAYRTLLNRYLPSAFLPIDIKTFIRMPIRAKTYELFKIQLGKRNFEFFISTHELHFKLAWSPSIFKAGLFIFTLPSLVALVFVTFFWGLPAVPAITAWAAVALAAPVLMSFFIASFSREEAPSFLRSLKRLIATDREDLTSSKGTDGMALRLSLYLRTQRLPETTKLSPEILKILQSELGRALVKDKNKKVEAIKTVKDLRGIVGSTFFDTWYDLVKAISELIQNTLFTAGAAVGFMILGAVAIGVPVYLWFAFDHPILRNQNAFEYFWAVRYLPTLVAAFLFPGIVGHIFAKLFLPLAYTARAMKAIQEFTEEDKPTRGLIALFGKRGISVKWARNVLGTLWMVAEIFLLKLIFQGFAEALPSWALTAAAVLIGLNVTTFIAVWIRASRGFPKSKQKSAIDLLVAPEEDASDQSRSEVRADKNWTPLEVRKEYLAGDHYKFFAPDKTGRFTVLVAEADYNDEEGTLSYFVRENEEGSLSETDASVLIKRVYNYFAGRAQAAGLPFTVSDVISPATATLHSKFTEDLVIAVDMTNYAESAWAFPRIIDHLVNPETKSREFFVRLQIPTGQFRTIGRFHLEVNGNGSIQIPEGESIAPNHYRLNLDNNVSAEVSLDAERQIQVKSHSNGLLSLRMYVPVTEENPHLPHLKYYRLVDPITGKRRYKLDYAIFGVHFFNLDISKLKMDTQGNPVPQTVTMIKNLQTGRDLAQIKINDRGYLVLENVPENRENYHLFYENGFNLQGRPKPVYEKDPIYLRLPYLERGRVKQLWDARMDAGANLPPEERAFRYRLGEIEETQVGRFTLQTNPGRLEREAEEARPMRDNNPAAGEPFDPAKNFNQIVKTKPAQHLFDTKVAGEDVRININYAPILKDQFLFIPYPAEEQTQVLTARALRTAVGAFASNVDSYNNLVQQADRYIQFLQNENIPHSVIIRGKEDLALGFNSWGAWASINHLHFQGWFEAPEAMPIEKAERKEIANETNVTVSELTDYPAGTKIYRQGDVTIYIVPRKRDRSETFPGGIGVLEVAGHFFTNQQHFDEVKQQQQKKPNEQFILDGLKPAVYSQEEFDALEKQYQTQRSQQPQRSEARRIAAGNVIPAGLGEGLESIQAAKVSLEIPHANPEFDAKFLQELSKITGRPLPVQGQASSNGYIFVQWNPSQHDTLLMKAMAEKAAPGVKIVIFAGPQVLAHLRSELRSQRFEFASPAEFDQKLAASLQRLGATRDDLVQIEADSANPSEVRAALVGAVRLSQGTVEIIGATQRIARTVIRVSEILQAAYAAVKVLAAAA